MANCLAEEVKTDWMPTHGGEMFSTGFFHRRIHFSDDPEKNADWVKRESPLFGGINSARWRREMEIDWGVYAGQRVWPMLDRKLHHSIVRLDEGWAVYRIIDHGIRHPTCCLWVAVNHNGDKHFFREYYATDKSVALNCRSIIALSNENVIDTFIDPSTKKRVNYLTSDASAEKQGLARLIDLYEENGILCSLADNSAAGYDKVKDGLLSQLARYALKTGIMPPYLAEMEISQEQLLMLASKSAISFDLRFIERAFRETENLRYKELTGDPGQHSAPEKTVDVADEGPDCIRYAVQSNIFWRLPIVVLPKGSYKETLLKRHLRRKYKRHHRWS